MTSSHISSPYKSVSKSNPTSTLWRRTPQAQRGLRNPNPNSNPSNHPNARPPEFQYCPCCNCHQQPHHPSPSAPQTGCSEPGDTFGPQFSWCQEQSTSADKILWRTRNKLGKNHKSPWVLSQHIQNLWGSQKITVGTVSASPQLQNGDRDFKDIQKVLHNSILHAWKKSARLFLYTILDACSISVTVGKRENKSCSPRELWRLLKQFHMLEISAFYRKA